MSTPLLQQFPSLATYPSSFLKDLLSSPALTEAFLFTLPEVQALVAQVEQLGKENDEVARRNLELRDELLALRENTAQAYGHAEAMKVQWQEIEKAQSQLYSRQRPSFLHLRLRHSITAQDDLSEKIASLFLEGKPIPQGIGTGSDSSSGGNTIGNGLAVQLNGLPSRVDSPAPTGMSTPISGSERGQNKAIDDFINEFKAARKTYHKRAIWAERWSRGEVAWRDD